MSVGVATGASIYLRVTNDGLHGNDGWQRLNIAGRKGRLSVRSSLIAIPIA